LGIKERVEKEAKDLATRAELLAEAKHELADKVSDIVDEQKKEISKKLSTETKKK
jgi:hypothetical protein